MKFEELPWYESFKISDLNVFNFKENKIDTLSIFSLALPIYKSPPDGI